MKKFFTLLLSLSLVSYAAAQVQLKSATAPGQLQARATRGAEAQQLPGQVHTVGNPMFRAPQASPQAIPQAILERMPAEYQGHPDLGRAPIPYDCADCWERIDLRTESARYYTRTSDPDALVISQSYGPLNWRDIQGRWRHYDDRLYPTAANHYQVQNQEWPATYDATNGATTLALPGGEQLRWNYGAAMVKHQGGSNYTLLQNLQTSAAQSRVDGHEAYMTGVAGDMDKQLIFTKNGVKTNYILHKRPQLEAGSVVGWQERMALPQGWQVTKGEGHYNRHGHWVGDLYLTDAAGTRMVRMDKPVFKDARVPGTNTQEDFEHFSQYLEATGTEMDDYGYAWQWEDGELLMTVYLSSNYLLYEGLQYPVVIDPQITVTASYGATIGSQQGATCSGATTVTVPGGYSIESTFVSIAYQSTASCALCIFGICFPFGSAFPCLMGNAEVQVDLGCASMGFGSCGTASAGTCTISGFVNISQCIVPACTDYSMPLNFRLINYSDCGGASCASTSCFYINPGGAGITIYARNIEVAITASTGTPPTINICQGETVDLTATATWGIAPYTYSWSPTTDLTCAPTCNSATVTSQGVAVGSNTYTVTATDNCGNTRTASVTVTTNPTLANNTISSTDPNPICQYSVASNLTGSTPTGGTGTYTYQWQQNVNGGGWTNLGTGINQAGVTLSTAGTHEFRRIAYSGNCSPVISNVLSFTVTTADVIVNNTITSPSLQYCTGSDPATITGLVPPALSGGDGATYTYQWQQSVNGGAFADIGGATGPDYDPPVLALVGAANTTYTFRRNVSSGSCQSVASNTQTLTIYTNIATNTITAPATTIICVNGDPANIVGSTPTASAGGYTYQWQQNVNSGGWANIAGATAQSYDPPALATLGTWQFRRLTSSGPCLDAVTNTVTITITDLVASNTINPPTLTTLCSPADFTVFTGSLPTGGNGTTYTYQWQQSINGAAFTNVGGNTQNYDPGAITVATVSTYQFRRLVTSGACASSISDTETVVIQPPLANNNLTAPATVNFCLDADPDLIVGSVAPTLTGGTGAYSYQWEISVNSTTVYTAIPGAVAADYDPTTLPVVGGLQTIYRFRRIVTSGMCTNTSAAVAITINPGVTNTIPVVATSYCGSGDPANIAAAAATGGGGAGYAYQWQVDIDGGGWNNVVGATAQAYDPPMLTNATATTVVYRYRRVASSVLCPTLVPSTQEATYTLLPTLANNTITAPATTDFCLVAGSATPDIITGTDATGGTGTPTYVWQFSTNGGGTWANVTATLPTGAGHSGFGARDLDLGTITAGGTYLFRRNVTSGACVTANSSNSVTLVVTAAFANNTLTAPATINFCGSGDPAVINNTGVLSGGTGAYTYQWQVSTDGVTYADIPGATAQTYDSPVLAPIGGVPTAYRFRRLISSGNCTNIPSSNVITITIQPAIDNNNAYAPATTALCVSTAIDPITGDDAIGGTGTPTYLWQVSSNGGGTWASVTATVPAGSGHSGFATRDLDLGLITTAGTYLLRRQVTTGFCTTPNYSDTITLTIYPALSANTISSAAAFYCDGADLALINATTVTGGDGVISYQWQMSVNNTTSFADITGATAEDYDPPVLNVVSGATTLYYFRRVVTSANCATSTSANVLMTMYPALASNTVTAPATLDFCGTGATANPAVITGSVATGGGTFTYGWIWSSTSDTGPWTPVAAASPAGGAHTFPNASRDLDLTNLTIAAPITYWFRRVVTAQSTACRDTSAAVQMNFTPTPSANTLTAPATVTFCGSADPAAITGTAMTVGGGGAITYQWQENINGAGWNDIGGATAQDYDPGMLNTVSSATTTYAYRRLATTGLCVNIVSTNTVTITLNHDAIANNTITAPATVNFCGTAINPAAIVGSVPTGGSGAYTYTWQYSTDNATWNTVTTALPAAGVHTFPNASRDLDLTSITVASTFTYYFRRQVAAAGCAPAGVSNTITMTFNPALGGANTLTPSAPTTGYYCESVNPGNIAGSLMTGGTGAYTYVWEYNVNGGAFVTIAGATSQSYDPGALMASVGTDSSFTFRRTVVSGNCTSVSAATAAWNVRRPIQNNTISTTTTSYCLNADPDPVTGTTPDGGGNPAGAFTYLWQYSLNGGAWTNIAANVPVTTPASGTTGFNAINLDLGIIATAGTYDLRRIVSRTPCTANPYQDTSNVVTLNLGTLVSNNTLTAPATTDFCDSGDPGTITGTDDPVLTGGTPPYTFSWQVRSGTTNPPTSAWSDMAGETGRDLDPAALSSGGTTTYYQYRRGVTTTCGIQYSSALTFIVRAPLVAGSAGTVTTPQCVTANITAFTGTTVATGAVSSVADAYAYQWEFSTDGGGSWANVTATNPPVNGANHANFAAQTLDLGILLNAGTYTFRRGVTRGPCTVQYTSNVTLVVSPNDLANNTITAPATTSICSNPDVVTGSDPTGGTGTYTYVWEYSTNGGTNWFAVAANAPVTNPASGTTFPNGGRDLDLGNVTVNGTYLIRRTANSGCTSGTSATISLGITPNLLAGTATFTAATGCGSVNPALSTSAAATGGTGAYTYRWQYSTNGGTSWNDVTTTDPAVTATVNAATIDLGVISTPGSYTFRRLVSSGNCVDVIANVAQAIVVQPTIANNTITAPATTDLCVSTTIDAITGTDATGGTGTPTYVWQYRLNAGAWANVTATLPTGSGHAGFGARDLDLGLITTAGTYDFRRNVTSGSCSVADNSNMVTIVVRPSIATNTITSVAAFYCDGTDLPVINASAATGGDGSYSYQWQVSINGGTFNDIGGANSQNYDPPVLNVVSAANTTYTYRRNVTSNSCATSTSGTVVMTMYPALATNTLTAPATVDFCGTGAAANPAVITGSVATGGGTFTYSWIWSSTAATGPWTPVAAASPAGGAHTFPNASRDLDLTNLTIAAPTTYWFRRVVTAQNTACRDTSAAVQMTFTPALTAGTLSYASNPASADYCGTVDPGEIQFTADAGGTGSFSYVWERRANSGAWTTISGATSANYDPPVISASTLSDSLIDFRRTVTSGNCVVQTTSAVYRVRRVLANNTLTPPSPLAFCGSGANPGVITGSAPTGGTGTYTYTWQWSSDGGGSWNTVAGASPATGAHTFPNANRDLDLANVTFAAQTTYLFRRLVVSGPCTTPSVSDTVTMTFTPAITANTITAAALNVCEDFDPAAFTGTTVTGGDGTILYQWEIENNTAPNVWVAIPAATGTGYDSPPLAYLGTPPTTIYRFRRIVTSGNCSNTSAVSGNMTIRPALASNTVTAPAATTFCNTGQPETIVGATPTGGDGVYTYAWIQRFNGGAWAAATGTNNAVSYSPPLLTTAGTYEYARRLTSGNCGVADTSNIVTIVLNAGTPISGNTVTAPATIHFCISGDPAIITAGGTLAGGGGGYTYQWQENINSTGYVDIAGATAATYDPPMLSTLGTYLYRRVVTGTCGSSISSPITIVVQPDIMANTLTPPTPTTFCGSGDAGNIVGNTPVGGDGTYAYSWELSIDGGAWTPLGVTTRDYDPPLLNTDGVYEYRRMVTSGACTTPTATSTVTVTVSSPPAGTLFSWVGTTGDWNDPANWDQGCVPNCQHRAQIVNGGTAQIGAYTAPIGYLMVGSTSTLSFEHTVAMLQVCDTLVLNGSMVVNGGPRQMMLTAQNGIGSVTIANPTANPFDAIVVNTAANDYVVMETDVRLSATGVLTFTSGSIYTENEIRLLNSDPAAIVGEGALTHVFSNSGTPGTIVRVMGQLGSYVYPTGTRRAGTRYYMPTTLNYADGGNLFTHSALAVTYIDGPPSNGGLPLTDCGGNSFDITLNSGLWDVTPEGAGSPGIYSLTQQHAWGSYSNHTGYSLWTIASRDASPWALIGACGSSSPGAAPNTPLVVTRVAMNGFSEKATIQATTLLPVADMWLKATPQVDDIRLDWTTQAELNNAGFWLQRGDGTNFEDITWVDGAGTSNQASNYRHVDTDVQRGVTYYYRLRQLDLDGGEQYSNIASARLEPGNGISVSLYPQPATDHLTLGYTLPEQQPLTAELYNALGQRVGATYTHQPDGLQGTWTLNLEGLAAGTYSLHIRSGSYYTTLRMVKVAR